MIKESYFAISFAACVLFSGCASQVISGQSDPPIKIMVEFPELYNSPMGLQDSGRSLTNKWMSTPTLYSLDEYKSQSINVIIQNISSRPLVLFEQPIRLDFEITDNEGTFQMHPLATSDARKDDNVRKWVWLGPGQVSVINLPYQEAIWNHFHFPYYKGQQRTVVFVAHYSTIAYADNIPRNQYGQPELSAQPFWSGDAASHPYAVILYNNGSPDPF